MGSAVPQRAGPEGGEGPTGETRVAPRTRLKPRTQRTYGAARRERPPALLDAVRAAGARPRRIGRGGLDLFRSIECEDDAVPLPEPGGLAANRASQERMAVLRDASHDDRSAGPKRTLPVQWP
jgi:L-rhamnose mutarotase